MPRPVTPSKSLTTEESFKPAVSNKIADLIVQLVALLDQRNPVPQQQAQLADLGRWYKTAIQPSVLQKLGNPPGVAPGALAAHQCFHLAWVDQHQAKPVILQNVPNWPPPGRRWRTESPRCWPPSAAQTWCAVFPRHAFTKALASALQWKESVSPVAPAHTRHTSCASVAVSSRSCASICTDATKCAARSNCRVC